MANAAPKIVARNFHEAHTFAREVLKLSQGTYRVVANPAALFGYGEVHLVPGWDKRPDRFAVRNKLRYTRLTVIDHAEEKPAEEQDESSNGDNMVSEGGPVFTIFSNPEAWLKETEVSLRPADSNPLFVAPADLMDRVAGGISGDDLPSLFDDLKNVSVEVKSDGGHEVAATLQAQENELKELDEDIDVKEDDSDNDVEDERPLNGRRRRRCKDCGDLIHPDDVEEHAAEEATKKAALEKKAQERLK